MLRLSDISVSYEGSRILRGVSLTVPERSLVCLMGRNGVGKSTTLKAIVGLVRLDSGEVSLAEKPLASLKPASASVTCRRGATFFHTLPSGRI